MSSRVSFCHFLLVASAIIATHSASAHSHEGVEAELRLKTQTLLDAIAPGDVSVWQGLLDARAIQIDENDVVRNKAQILKELKPLPPGLIGHLKIDDFAVVRRGDVAIVTHEDDEYLDYHGQVILSRFRMTDTWVRSHAGWRLLGSQVLAVLKDPPAQSLSAASLCQYTGRYQMTDEIRGGFRCQADELSFEQEGRPERHFRPEAADVFFEPGAPRSRRIFNRDADGRISGFVDRREGRDIVWTRLPD
jgi:Domain of unknown function (DUF4440)